MRISQPQVPKPHQPQRLTRDKDAGKRATFIIDTRTSDNAQTKVLKSHQPQRPPRDKDAGKRTTCIIDTRTSENPQTRIEGKLDDLIKGVADIPSKVCDEFMKRCVESEKELVRKSKEAEGLRSELQSLKKQLQQQETDSQKKVEQLERQRSLKKQLQKQKAESQGKIAELTKTIQRLGDDRRKLREVIPGNALRYKISDDEIRQRFVNIRQQIQAVVNSPAYDMTREFRPEDAVSGNQLPIHQRYNSYCPVGRVLFLRCIVYRILWLFILSRDAFGLAGSVPLPESNQDAPEALLNRFLGASEDLLRSIKGAVVLYLLFSASSHANKPLVADPFSSDWTLATFKCTENFTAAIPRDRSTARDQIWRFLRPLVIYELDPVETRKEINQLCDDAFALWLLTRVSGDRYSFDGPEMGVKY
ncbi:hypothetical protein E4U26_000502 [Claviceps purpurea]|nr:hypothetical protein E4U26_000502 [Claviceps purpurea]